MFSLNLNTIRMNNCKDIKKIKLQMVSAAHLPWRMIPWILCVPALSFTLWTFEYPLHVNTVLWTEKEENAETLKGCTTYRKHFVS
jgi:hypothetical protein